MVLRNPALPAGPQRTRSPTSTECIGTPRPSCYHVLVYIGELAKIKMTHQARPATFLALVTVLPRLLRASVVSAAILASSGCVTASQLSPTSDWPAYGGTNGDRYSPLTQINTANVANLQQVWRFDTGLGGLQTTPLVIGGTLFGVTPLQEVFAVNAASGTPIWRFKPQSTVQQPVRGLAYWRQGAKARLFTSNGPYLTALDPMTGKPVDEFGAGGSVDMREGLHRPVDKTATYVTTPGVIYRDLIILGFRTTESKPAAPGAVRAYDVRTGELRWTYHAIPRPGEAGHETWPADAWKTAGGANVWAGMVVDQKRGIVYAPTGSAVDDFYGGDRLGDNLYANSLLALDAKTGKRLWHFQAVHHDIWDRDLPSPPVLLSVTRNGKRIDAVAQPTKQGVLFVFDRVTGEPLFPIEERPVPQTDVPGERSSPTQPFPLKPAPFARQRLTADMLTDRTAEARTKAAADFATFRNNGPFTPLALERQTVVFPGFDGGAEWGGPAVDPAKGLLIINSNDLAWTGSLRAVDANVQDRGKTVYQEQCAACHGINREGAGEAFPPLVGVADRLNETKIRQVITSGRGRMPGFPGIAKPDLDALINYLRGHAFGEARELPAAETAPPRKYLFTGYRKFTDPDGYPAVKPPWGTLNAIDLNTGEYIWKIPLGEYPELLAKGMPNSGCENYGGPVMTAGGIVIIGATICDRKIRAFETKTGRLLWSATLPYGGTATPATYMVGGRQYVVIATSGQRDRKGPQGTAYVAFALPM